MGETIRAPKTDWQLDGLKKRTPGTFPAPIGELLGLRVVEVGLGRSAIEMDVEGRYANPMGTLHGGIICDLADAAMGAAMVSTLEQDESFTTLDLHAKYFKPIWNAHLRAVATVTKRTNSLGLVECEIEDKKGSLVAKVFSTCMVLRGPQAKGR